MKFKNKALKRDLDYVAESFGNAFEGKTILITGCAGFLGFFFSHFFAYLTKNGVNLKLILLDNFMLGRPSWVEEIGDNDRIKIHAFDVSKDDIKTIPLSERADFVIHMASIASPTFYRKYPIQTIDANVWGLRSLLDNYKASALKGLLFFSSSEIYGDPLPEYIPTNEEYRGNVSCIGPRACYDEAKRFGETLCYEYAREYNMPITIVRPFNNYGPGMRLDDRRVPADFAKAVVNGEDIVIHSDGTPTRTFCYVSDAVTGYLKALAYGRFDYFNIGIDRPEISVRELAEIYREAGRRIWNYGGKIIYERSEDKNYLTHNPSRRRPDITKARTLLGFNPRIMADEGVGQFLEYLREEEKEK